MNSKKSVFLIGDEAVDKQYFFNIIGVAENEAQNSDSLSICISNYLSHKLPLEIYNFPSDRSLRPYYDLYIKLLEKPELLIYFVGIETNKNQIIEWINLFSPDNSNRIVFFSDAKTYWERQQIIFKLCPLFLTDIVEHIYFPNIDQASISTCLCNLGEVGMPLHYYAPTISTVSQVKWRIKRVFNYLRKQSSESVI